MKYSNSRHTIRLRGFDYSQANWYYVTICTNHHESLFVHSAFANNLQLNDIGQIAHQCWLDIPNHYSNVKLDEFIIMPNHVHGIIIINTQTTRANNDSPLPNNNQSQPRIQTHGTSNTIGAIVRGFKIGVTKWCRANTQIYDVWQRNYYEHIIRDKGELTHIRKYIKDNPKNWETDKLNVHLPVPT